MLTVITRCEWGTVQPKSPEPIEESVVPGKFRNEDVEMNIEQKSNEHQTKMSYVFYVGGTCI